MNLSATEVCLLSIVLVKFIVSSFKGVFEGGWWLMEDEFPLAPPKRQKLHFKAIGEIYYRTSHELLFFIFHFFIYEIHKSYKTADLIGDNDFDVQLPFD